MNKKEAILKVVNKVGSQAELARRLGISRGFMHDMLSGRTAISSKIVRKLVELSEGEVSESDLRPDIFYPINLDQKKIAACA